MNTEATTQAQQSATRRKYTTMNVTPEALAAFNLRLAQARASGFVGTQSDLLIQLSQTT